MTGLEKVAKESAEAMRKSTLAGKKNCYLPIYYSISEDKVSISKENDTFGLVTVLIRENTPKEIEQAVNRYLWM